jgi:lysophospholipase L1-like esterase
MTEHAEAADADCLSDDQADALLGGAPWQRFLALGDSLVAGVGDPSPGYRSVPWVARVAEALRRQSPALEYRNLAVRQVRTEQVRADQLGPALDFGADLVTLVCGGNDLLTRRFDPDALEAEARGIVEPLVGQGAVVVLFTLMDATQAFPELAPLRPRLESLNAVMTRIAADHRGLLVDMWRHPAVRLPALYSADRNHPSMRGHAVLAAATIRRLGDRIAAPDPGRP